MNVYWSVIRCSTESNFPVCTVTNFKTFEAAERWIKDYPISASQLIVPQYDEYDFGTGRANALAAKKRG